MIGPRSLLALDALLGEDEVHLSTLSEAMIADRPALDDGSDLHALIDLGTRLPSGLVHAEAIWIVHEPPPGLQPLAPESAWYAMDRSLVVVTQPGRRSLLDLLADLARYHLAANRVAGRLGARPDLMEGLESESIDAPVAADLAVSLDASLQLVASLDRSAPGLRADLTAMARGRFDPVLRIHAALHPGREKTKGARLAESLLAKLPAGGFRLLVSDTAMVLEHLSPYVRDLGYALAAWGLENASSLRTTGLAEALAEGPDRLSTDLAALVVPDLFAAAPELLDERRRAEETAGLHLWDAEGSIAGFADLARLSLPDETAVARGASGTIALLASQSEDVVLQATAALLESGRVIALGVVLGSAIDARDPIVPDALATDADGIWVQPAQEIAERAQKSSIRANRIGAVRVDDRQGAPALAAELMGLARRAQVLGRVHRDAPTFPILYGRTKDGAVPPLEVRIGEVEAGRLALAFLSSTEDPPSASAGVRAMSQNAPGVSRRFRA
jgi:hypothetical protein